MAQKRKKSKKWIWWMVMLILFVAAGVIVYFVWDGYFREKPSVEVADGGEAAVADIVEENGKGQSENIEVVEKEKVVQYEGEDPNTQEELTGVITYAGVSGDNLMVRVNIDQYVTEGSCVLDLVQGGASVYSDAVGLVGGATTATCEGFNVSLGEIGGGKYQIVIKISSGDKTGTINGEVDI